MKAKFISIDGIEGSGKSTQISFIEQFLNNQGISTYLSREPGGSQVGNQIRTILLDDSNSIDIDTELLLMFAARKQHIEEVIKPKLARGIWVITDRFTDASYAYQGGGRGIDMARIAQLESWTQGDFEPDLSLFFDIPLETVAQRVNDRGYKDRFEQEGRDFFQRVQAVFLARAKTYPERIKLVNGNQSIRLVRQDVEQILKSIWQ